METITVKYDELKPFIASYGLKAEKVRVMAVNIKDASSEASRYYRDKLGEAYFAGAVTVRAEKESEARIIDLKNKDGYPETFFTSERFHFEEVGDGFISRDMSGKRYASGEKATGEPTITIMGTMIVASHHVTLPTIKPGDLLVIDGEEYRIGVDHKRTRSNANNSFVLDPA